MAAEEGGPTVRGPESDPWMEVNGHQLKPSYCAACSGDLAMDAKPR